ncbi:MAG: hypothetical protein P1U56_08530 [Saprospiraceae bacterium]|nr:hypothetical protein [Saprospiraceae bacterium]
MKKLLLFFLACLVYNTNYAQDKSNSDTNELQPITTTGISLPQLITTQLNRSELQFGINLSEGLEQPNLSIQFKKFISDQSKQISLNAGANLRHRISFDRSDNFDFYSIESISMDVGADLKLFNSNDYFIQFGTQNSIGKPGGLSNFDYIYTNNALTIGFGKGRIDFVNDAVAAVTITDKLKELGVLSRELTEQEYQILVDRINDLKNRRAFVNRSYPLTEVEEIHDLLSTFNVLKEGINTLAIIDDAYKYEPMIDRTTGSQFNVQATGTYHRSNFLTDYTRKGVYTQISYAIHKPINSKWQYNRTASTYFSISESNLTDPTFSESTLKRGGIRLNNDFHYLVDTRLRISFTSGIGYNVIDESYIYDPFGNSIYDNKGMFLNLGSELEYQISRTMSINFGLNLNITPDYNFTGLHMGLKF